NGRGQLQQPVVQLFLRFRHRGQGVDAQEQGSGLVVVDVQGLHVDQHVRVEVAAQVAVEQLQAAVGQFVGEQAAGEADLAVQRFQDGALLLGGQAEVQLVGVQV